MARHDDGGMMLMRPTVAAVALALLLCLGPSPARAESGQFPAGHLGFVLPAQWSAEANRSKLSLLSPGEDAFIVLSVLPPGDDNLLRAEAGQQINRYLADVALADGGHNTRLGGMPALRFKGTGSSDATSVAFAAAVVVPDKATPVLVLAYTTSANFAAAEPLFEAFFASLKPR
jgi:hypothetical protein